MVFQRVKTLSFKIIEPLIPLRRRQTFTTPRTEVDQLTRRSARSLDRVLVEHLVVLNNEFFIFRMRADVSGADSMCHRMTIAAIVHDGQGWETDLALNATERTILSSARGGWRTPR